MRITRAAVGILAAAGLILASAAPAAAAAGDQCHRVNQQANGNVGILNGVNVYLPGGGYTGGSWLDGWGLFNNNARYSDGDRSVNCGDGWTTRKAHRHHAAQAPASAGYGNAGR